MVPPAWLAGGITPARLAMEIIVKPNSLNGEGLVLIMAVPNVMELNVLLPPMVSIQLQRNIKNITRPMTPVMIRVPRRKFRTTHLQK